MDSKLQASAARREVPVEVARIMFHILFIVAGGEVYLWLELVSVFPYNDEDVSDAKQF